MKLQARRVFFNVVVLALVCMLVFMIGYRPASGTQEASATVSAPVISEVMASNSSAWMDDKGNFPDWVELFNPTGYPINLQGYGLTDKENGSAKWLFPNTSIASNAYMVILLEGSTAVPQPNSLCANFALSAGETLVLLDPTGEPLDSCPIVPAGKDVSLVRDTDGQWITTGEYTPGYPNTTEGYVKFNASRALDSADVELSEISPANRTMAATASGEFYDWIELYNKGNSKVDLTGWALSDNEYKPMKWRFPKGASIAAGEYLLVYCPGDAPHEGEGIYTDFALSTAEMTVTLSTSRGASVDSVVVRDIPDDASYSRVDGEWKTTLQATPGYKNDDTGVKAMQKQVFAQNPGVYISEVVSQNSVSFDTKDGASSDWIEIHNAGKNAVNLEGWGLSDSVSRPLMWTFPSVSVPPGGYLVLAATGAPAERSSVIHAGFGLSKDGGEILTLATPERKVVDKIIMPALPEDMSYGRTPGEDGFFYYEETTPGGANEQGYAGFMSAPTFTVHPGVTDAPVNVAVNADEGAVVHYTTDGREPTAKSPTMNGALTLSKTGMLRVKAYKEGYLPSPVVTGTYIIGDRHELPIVSLVMNPDDMFSKDSGIHANPSKDWEKPGNAEFIGFPETSPYYSAFMGIKMSGQFSLTRDQKSFTISARREYGTSRFEINPFQGAGRDFESYNNFVVRSSSQDDNRARMRDAVLSSLLEDTGVLYQAAQPIALYINGQYWGHYNLRERINEHFVAQHENVIDPDEVKGIAMVKHDNSAKNGTLAEWKALQAWLKDHKLDNDANLKYLLDRVDAQNYFDYVIAEMWLGNSDTGNLFCYKLPGEDAKWKWILYDVDWAMNSGEMGPQWDTLKWYTKEKGHGVSAMFSSLLIRRLLENPETRELFIERYAYAINHHFSSDNVIAHIDAYADKIRPELSAHYERWPSQGSISSWEKHVERMRDFARARNDNMEKFLKSYFGLSSARMSELFPN